MKALAATFLTTTILAASAFLFLSFSIPPQPIPLTILPGSSLTINGYTNVDDFACTFCERITDYPEQVYVAKANNSWQLDSATLAIPVEGFDCGIRQLNRDFRELVCAETHKEFLINLKRITFEGQTPAGACKAVCIITLAGKQRQVTIPVVVTQEDDLITCTSTAHIELDWFDLEPPTKLMGLVKVRDYITVDIHLLLKTG